jgi:hypothetical protein
MLRRISIFFLLLFSTLVHADLYFETYRGTGALPNMPYYGTGTLTFPTALSSGTVTSINHNWGSGNVLNSGRAEQVLVKYWGQIYVPGTGSQTLTFYNSSDDGFYMRINNQVVINDWQEQGPAFYNGSGSITLTGGQYYDIEAWYYENGGGAAAQLYWNQSGSIALVPTSSYHLIQPAPQTPTYSSGITNAQQTRKTDESTQRTSQSGNGIYIDQIGDNNNITIRQGITITGKNRIELYANGNNNTLNLNQGYNTDGSIPVLEYNNHYQYLNLSGASNNITTKQTNGTVNLGHFMETTVSGNTNVLNLTQQGTGSKTIFLNVNGGSNSVTTNQKDGGQHYLDLSLTGNGHTVNATQEGTGNHAATINFTNSGGSSTLNMNQSGSTNQTYSINQSCANASGCSTTISQP